MALARRRSTTTTRPKTRTRTVVKTRRVGPSPKMIRAQKSQAALSATRRAEKRAQSDDMLALAAAAALAAATRKGLNIPVLGEVGQAGTVGLAMWAAPFLMKNNTGRRLRAASVGPLAVAVHEFVEDSSMLSFLDGE